MTQSEIIEHIRSLPRPQRVRIVETIVGELDEIPPLTEELEAELNRRIAASEADPSRLLTQEQFNARFDQYRKQVKKKRA